MLKAWQANMDLQAVHNYYKAISYMAAYFSKSENETSQALKETVKEIKEQNLQGKEAMYKLACSFILLQTIISSRSSIFMSSRVMVT